jgi:SAM-dependent methyltransferase
MNSATVGLPDTNPCPICDGARSWAVPFLDPELGTLLTRAEGYHWRLCANCGNAFPSKVFSLAELQAYWDRNRVGTEEVAEVPDAVWENRWRASQIWAQRTYEFVAPHLQEDMNAFIDFACGLGAMVALFRDKGWHAEGIDADPNTRRYHEKAGVSVTIGQIENLEPGAVFDLVSIAHAIYFVTQPRQFVQRVGAMLKPGGYSWSP